MQKSDSRVICLWYKNHSKVNSRICSATLQSHLSKSNSISLSFSRKFQHLIIVRMLFRGKSPKHKSKVLRETLTDFQKYILRAGISLQNPIFIQHHSVHRYIHVWRPFNLHMALHFPLCLLPSHGLVPPPPHTVFVPEEFHIPRWIKSLQINIIHSCGCSSCMIMWKRMLIHTHGDTAPIKLQWMYNRWDWKEMDPKRVLSSLSNKLKLPGIYLSVLMMDAGRNIRNTHINNSLY